MRDAFLCGGFRTPIGRFGGGLSMVRADDLAALPITALLKQYPGLKDAPIDDVILGCANQAGEDGRNVARMAGLLSGLSQEVPGITVNRLCGSGLEAVIQACRAIQTGEADIIIAGGVEAMSRAPFVMGKADNAFSRNIPLYDTTLGPRFPNDKMIELYGSPTMPETAENVAADYQISREDQDAFALRSQQRYARAQEAKRFEREICPVTLPQRKGEPVVISRDEHPRTTSLDKLAALRTIVNDEGTVTAGNASGINDGAAALVIASREAAARYGLNPQTRYAGAAVAGVAPRVMGIGPAPATEKLLSRLDIKLTDVGVIELNEAFAAQALGVLRLLGIPDDAGHVNPNGGAIALGHPLGMSGARLALTATHELHERGERYALVTMCIGVGQGIAALLEAV